LTAASTKQTALSEAVLAVTTLCPRIVRAAAKAAHGPFADRRHQLHQARQLIKQLASCLELAEIAVFGSDEFRPPKGD
jgi:hypothetical protein